MSQKAEMKLVNPSTGLYETYHIQTEPDMIVGWARKKSTAYAVGDVVVASALDVSKQLICVQAGTTGSGSLIISSTAYGTLITDGTVTWMVDSIDQYYVPMLFRNKAYAVGDIAYSRNLPSYLRLECVAAGTTGTTEPDFSGVSTGGV